MEIVDTNLHFAAKLTIHFNANYLQTIFRSCSSVYLDMTNFTTESPCHKV